MRGQLICEVSPCNPKKLTGEDVEQLGHLLYQLTNGKVREVSQEQIIRTTQHGILLLARGYRSGKIYGCATVHFHEPLTGGSIIIDDVVVDENYRGRGIGRKIMETAHNLATQYPEYFNYVELTSGNHRAAAHVLYQHLGYEKVDTTVFRHTGLVKPPAK